MRWRETVLSNMTKFKLQPTPATSLLAIRLLFPLVRRRRRLTPAPRASPHVQTPVPVVDPRPSPDVEEVEHGQAAGVPPRAARGQGVVLATVMLGFLRQPTRVPWDLGHEIKTRACLPSFD